MVITKEQIEILDSFSCERLSSNISNRNTINNFYNPKGELLIDYLQKYGWKDDTSGVTAFYLIKSPDNEIIMFFSLKCGVVFKTLDIEKIQQRTKTVNELIKFLRENVNDKKTRIKLIEQYRSGQNISFEELFTSLDNYEQYRKKLELINIDIQQESNPKIMRVEHTYPSIEIVHFCTNKAFKERWASYNFNHPMGEVMFWKYIVPKIYEVQRIVGCQYVYLFAADMSRDGTLINYYKEALKFIQPMDIGTSKPTYDLCCYFMCQEMTSLKQNERNYFNNFNSDDNII